MASSTRNGTTRPRNGTTPSRRPAKLSVAKRRQILTGARKVFAERGFEAASVDEAAARAGAIAHRHARTAKVLDALAAGPGTLEEITARAYDDTPPAIHPLAARSCLATLELLRREGRAATSGDRWSATGQGS